MFAFHGKLWDSKVFKRVADTVFMLFVWKICAFVRSNSVVKLLDWSFGLCAFVDIGIYLRNIVVFEM